MTSRPDRETVATPFGAPVRWNPMQAFLLGGTGLYFVVSTLGWYVTNSSFEFWARLVVGVALIVFGALDINALRRGTQGDDE